MKVPSSLALLFTTALALPVSAVDWPQWRGPNRDGNISDPQHKMATLPPEPKVLWQIEAGTGQASPVVSGKRLIYLDAQDKQETAHCVDTETGKAIWTHPIAPIVQFQNNYGDGPRCTPLIDGDRVYVQSCSGEFQCLAIADAKVLWHINFEKDYGATFLGNFGNDPEAKETASRRHGNNGSAAIDGNRIFVPVGSPKGATLVCFDKMTGQELWKAGNDNTAYASVMVATLAGTKQAVHFTADALMGVEEATGKILWRIPLKTGAKRHVCTPVISGDTVTVASTTIGTLKFKIEKKGDAYTASQVWADLPLKTVISSPVLHGPYLYTIGPGSSRTDLECVDFETGKPAWTQSGFADYASITVVNDKILALNSTGELFLVNASPDKYEELGRAQVCGKTWASPAYSNGRIYVKDDKHITALQIDPGLL